MNFTCDPLISLYGLGDNRLEKVGEGLKCYMSLLWGLMSEIKTDEFVVLWCFVYY